MAFIMEAEQYNKWLYASQGYITHPLNADAANLVWTEEPKRSAFRDAAERSLSIGGRGPS
jgi:multiple sugar transport system substrate-binding protein